MTNPPPPDPLWQPIPPAPDPVLRGPAPMPWEQPWQPSPPPAPPSVPDEPPAPAPRTRPARSGPTPQTRTTYPYRPTDPITTLPRGPVRFRPWNGPATAVLALLLVVCGGFIAGVVRPFRAEAPNGVPAPVVPSRVHSPAVSFSAPATVVDGGPATSFDLPAGTGVRFSDQDGTWTVALLGVEWIDDCADVLGSTVAVVVFDIRYEVIEGAVSIIPLTDFALVLPNGTTARVGLLSACAEPALDYAVISAGEVRRGQIAVELPAGVDASNGKLTYGQLRVPTASWVVPARSR